MKYIITILILTACSYYSNAQIEVAAFGGLSKDTVKAFEKIEVEAEFPGGQIA